MRDRNARRDTLKTPASLLPDSQTLTLRLASALGPDADKQRSVRILSRTLPPFMSTFPNEIVTCQLPDGRKRRVFIKYQAGQRDRKSTRLNSSHEWISYAVFCLKKKKNKSIKSRSKMPNRHEVQLV